MSEFVQVLVAHVEGKEIEIFKSNALVEGALICHQPNMI